MTEKWNLNALCRCCHKDGHFKNLQTPDICEDGVVIYSDLLLDTLGVNLKPPAVEASNCICDECIDQLRRAALFKRQVLACEHRFQEYCTNEQALNLDAKVTFEETFENVELPFDMDVVVKVEESFKNENSDAGNNSDDDGARGCDDFNMSRSKPRKRGCTWDEDSLRCAMEAVRTNKLNPSAAAIRFNIPRRTLRNHLLTGKTTKNIGKAAILTKQQEEDLAQRIKHFAKLGIPLTSKFIRKQAFLFCERFKIKHLFSLDSKMAGRKWLKMFLRRNPAISKRKPQIMNPVRAQKLNKYHFEEVKKLYQELDIIAHPERLYNMDEKGCRITVHGQNVVLAEKGNTRFHLVAPEHAENVTIAMCVNAAGSAIPPMIIFRGVRYRPELGENLRLEQRYE